MIYLNHQELLSFLFFLSMFGRDLNILLSSSFYWQGLSLWPMYIFVMLIHIFELLLVSFLLILVVHIFLLCLELIYTFDYQDQVSSPK